MQGCGVEHYNTLTRAHTHQYVWVLPGPVPKSMKAGFYPTYYRYFFADAHRAWVQLPSLSHLLDWIV